MGVTRLTIYENESRSQIATECQDVMISLQVNFGPLLVGPNSKTVPNVGTENEAPTVGALDPSCRGESSLRFTLKLKI